MKKETKDKHFNLENIRVSSMVTELPDADHQMGDNPNGPVPQITNNLRCADV